MIRVALVHDWLTGMRGGEYVFEAIAELFQDPDLFTLLYIPGSVSPSIATLRRHTSRMQNIPGASKRYRHFLPLMPRFIEEFDLTGYDLVVSSSHCVAKGIRKPPGAIHVSYVHAPMRYIWNRYDDYFGPGKSSLLTRMAAMSVRKYLQNWDRNSSQSDRVDLMIANSHYIAEQIQAAYGRESKVIYPFADLERFNLSRRPGSKYLMVTAFAPYKRVDLAIEAFNQLRLPLQIVGSGQDERKLRKAAGPTVEFLGSQSNAVISELYSKAKAFIFPGVEDFGITPVEALAAGVPVIALREGGAAETVTDQTGVLFYPQTVEALKEAILKIENAQVSIDPKKCRARGAEFSKKRFQMEFKQALFETWEKAGKDSKLLSSQLALTSPAHFLE